ncbi:MAG: DUF1330 domain-containing protein [Alphaproteobacteria bacterium]|nr:DUF1330 domain-containing protein [Alphaproteobacteria bacterium]
MPKGYIIGMITVNDAEAYKPYMEGTTPLVVEYGGTYLVRGGEKNVVEGSAPFERIVVIEFDSIETAQKFYDDPRYVEVRKIRTENSDGFLAQVVGYDMPA